MKSGLTIEEQVLEVVRNILFGVEINLDSIVLNASGIDRDFQRDLVMTLEEELEVEIPDADAEKLVTVKDIANYITKKKTPVEPKKVEPKVEKPKKEVKKVEEKKPEPKVVEPKKEEPKKEVKSEKKEEKKSE